MNRNLSLLGVCWAVSRPSLSHIRVAFTECNWTTAIDPMRRLTASTSEIILIVLKLKKAKTSCRMNLVGEAIDSVQAIKPSFAYY